jgi:hypothetical protein
MRADGETWADIGWKLGLPRNTVIRRGRRLRTRAPAGLSKHNASVKAQAAERRGLTPEMSAAELKKIINVRVMPPDDAGNVRTCQWIFGELRERGHFCGVAVFMPGKSYCAEHHAIAFWRRDMRVAA